MRNILLSIPVIQHWFGRAFKSPLPSWWAFPSLPFRDCWHHAHTAGAIRRIPWSRSAGGRLEIDIGKDHRDIRSQLLTLALESCDESCISGKLPGISFWQYDDDMPMSWLVSTLHIMTHESRSVESCFPDRPIPGKAMSFGIEWIKSFGNSYLSYIKTEIHRHEKRWIP